MKIKMIIISLLSGLLHGIPAYSQDTNNSCKTKTWSIFYYSDKGLGLSAADSAFMRKYHVKYYHVNKPSARKENLYAFHMLDKQYGKRWRKVINRNAIALKEYFRSTGNSKKIRPMQNDFISNSMIVTNSYIVTIPPDCF